MTVTVKWSLQTVDIAENKTIDLKGIIDDALVNTPCVANVLVVKRTNSTINMKEGRDQWLQPL
jgi:acetyl-CoA synthetase